MKRNFFIVVLFLFIFLTYFFIKQAVYAKKNNNEKWAKVNEYIYIDKSSITQNIDGATAWIKIYTQKNKIYKINGVPVYYKIEKYDAGCEDVKALFLLQTKWYNKDNNLISDYTNTHDVGVGCDSFNEDNIICKAICDYYIKN